MSIAIPERILNYHISAATPTDELLTLKHIYSEVGEYASTILDREHTVLSKKCATRLNKVEYQLSSRHNFMAVKEEGDDRYAEARGANIISTGGLDDVALSALAVDELYDLYRTWHLHHRKREAEGREHMTFYFEGRIVKELQRRKAVDKGEQLKIDYCAITYRNELENLAFIFSLPIFSLQVETSKELAYPEKSDGMKCPEANNGLIYPEGDRFYTPSELLALIKLYSHYRTISERELLIEYVDIALNLMAVTQTSADKIPYMTLASELVEISRKSIIRIPCWVSGFLEEALEATRKDESVHESELVLPLLTLQLQNGSPKLEREATRIINRCYRRAIALEDDLDSLVDDLYTAVTCCDYVSRFSVRKMGKSWNELANRTIASISASNISNAELNTRTIIRLLKVANEIEAYTPISSERKAILIERLEQ